MLQNNLESSTPPHPKEKGLFFLFSMDSEPFGEKPLYGFSSDPI